MKLGSVEATDALQLARTHVDLLQRAESAQTKTTQDAEAAFNTVRSELVQSVLAQIDIEQIKTVTEGRLSLEPLRAAGFRTVSQLSSAGVSRLQAVHGVGPATATKVVAAARQLSDAATKNLFVRIDPKTRPYSHRVLLEKVQLQEQIDHALAGRKDSFAVGRQLAQLSGEAGLATKGAIRRLFAGRSRRESAVSALDSLTTLLNSELLGAALGVANKVTTAEPPTAVWDDFVGRAADYFAYLTRLGVQEADATASVGGLPEHIVEAVRNQSLDDSLLDVRLRGYQAFGARYALVQRKVLLGDEMGLGKTIQALAVLGHLTAQDRKGFVVVCPGAVVANWTQEIRRKSKLTAVMIHGSAGERGGAFSIWQRSGGIGVMSFESARSLNQEGRFRAVDLALAVVDEAHYVKNRSALRSKAVASIVEQSERVLFMSGTPLENRVDEFESLVSYLQPDIARQLNGGMRSTALVAPQVFRERVAPVYLRRNQEDVLSELPERIESDEWLTPYSEERRAYNSAVRNGNFMAMRRTITIGDGALTSAKLDRLDEIIEQASDEGQRVLVFSFFRDVISAVVERRANIFGPIHGSVPPLERQTIIDKFSAADAPAVLVAQIQAGGTGLNIQAASVVVLMEPQIKPSLEEQAIARAHRMGQTRRVQVFRLLASDSVDERMVEILARKGRDFDAYARESSVKDAAPDASDVSDTRIATEVIALEQKRLADGERAALLAGSLTSQPPEERAERSETAEPARSKADS